MSRTRGLVLSPFRFAGGKSRMVPLLRPGLAQAGVHVLVEPFAGGASVSLAAVAEGLVDSAVLVERDDDVAAVWSVILGPHAPELAARVRAFRATPAAVAGALDSQADGSLDRAFRTLVANRVSRGGILHPRAGKLRRGERDRGLASRWYPDTLAERILAIHALRARLHFHHGDGLVTLRSYADAAHTAAFVDPPYTVGGRHPGARLYRHSDVDHPELFALVSGWQGPFLLTYDDAPQVRRLAAQHDLSVLPVHVRTTHHRVSRELVVGRQLGFAHHPSLRHRDSVSRRDASAGAATMAAVMGSPDVLHIADAATRLGISRRTAERLLSDAALVRSEKGDGRTYVTASSVAEVERRRVEPARRGTAGGELAAVLASMDKLLGALREDRTALLHALRERDEARAEAAKLRAELAAERARGPSASDDSEPGRTLGAAA